MTPRSQLRLLSLVPLLYALFGLWLIAATFSARQYLSPVPGFAAGIGLGLVALVAIRCCWVAQSRTPLWLAVSGVAAIAVLLLMDRILPLVNAVMEPPTLVERMWYPMTLGGVAGLTLLLPALAQACLRRSA